MIALGMKWWIGVAAVAIGIGIGGTMIWKGEEILSPRGREREVEERKLEKYDFDNLRRGRIYAIPTGEIEFLGEIREVEERRKALGRERIYAFLTQRFRFQSQGKWITGMVNRPISRERRSAFPTIIMIRGYADKEGYYTGSGSWKVADYLAASDAAGAGYATFSIDFLGFGGSEEESTDILEARFIKVVNVLDLIEAVKALSWVDKDKIGIWAHSNGGQIALSVLEVTGENYPTVLWAPMTEAFPQSVLSTVDENTEGGRYVKAEVDKFLKKYDSRKYAFENYLEWIEAPVLILQGTADEWCKVEWQTDLQSRLRALGKEVELVLYKGDDHNLSKNWEEAAERSEEWIDTYLKAY